MYKFCYFLCSLDVFQRVDLCVLRKTLSKKCEEYLKGHRRHLHFHQYSFEKLLLQKTKLIYFLSVPASYSLGDLLMNCVPNWGMGWIRDVLTLLFWSLTEKEISNITPTRNVNVRYHDELIHRYAECNMGEVKIWFLEFTNLRNHLSSGSTQDPFHWKTPFNALDI